MNLGTFRSRISGSIGLDNSAGSDEQVLMDGWVNEGVRKFLVRTHCRTSMADLQLTAGAGDYDLPSQVLVIKQLVDPSAPERPLEEVSELDIAVLRRTGSLPVRAYALSGSNRLQIAGVPDSDTTLDMTYVPDPTPMSDAAHDPSNATYGGVDEDFHDVIEAYAKWKAADYDDDTSSKVGIAYRDEWVDGVKNARVAINYKGGIRWAPARVGSRSRRQFTAIPNGVDFFPR